VKDSTPKNLSIVFDNEKSKNHKSSKNKDGSLSKERGNNIKKSLPIVKEQLKPWKKKKVFKSSKRMIKSQFCLEKWKESNKNRRVHNSNSRKTKINMIAIELESNSSEDSEEGSSEEEDRVFQNLCTSINSMSDFLRLLGARIDSETEDEVLINILSKNTSVTVPKLIFEEFCMKWNSKTHKNNCMKEFENSTKNKENNAQIAISSEKFYWILLIYRFSDW